MEHEDQAFVLGSHILHAVHTATHRCCFSFLTGSRAKEKGAAPPRGAVLEQQQTARRAWGHTGHNKGHSESLMWHLRSVNATLDLAPLSIFTGGVQIEAQEWEAGVKKRKIMDCWDVSDAETLRSKETEAFKLYFFDSEELWVEPGSRMAYWHFHLFS